MAVAIEAGDVASWASVAVSFAFSLAAFIISLYSLKHARRSADAAERSAVAAERQAIAAEKALPPPPPKVAWQIEQKSKHGFVLRNIGTDAATGVEIDKERAQAVLRMDLGDGIVNAGESISLTIMGTNRWPVPNELFVRWDGQPDWVAVPISRW